MNKRNFLQTSETEVRSLKLAKYSLGEDDYTFIFDAVIMKLIQEDTKNNEGLFLLRLSNAIINNFGGADMDNLKEELCKMIDKFITPYKVKDELFSIASGKRITENPTKEELADLMKTKKIIYISEVYKNFSIHNVEMETTQFFRFEENDCATSMIVNYRRDGTSLTIQGDFTYTPDGICVTKSYNSENKTYLFERGYYSEGKKMGISMVTTIDEDLDCGYKFLNDHLCHTQNDKVKSCWYGDKHYIRIKDFNYTPDEMDLKIRYTGKYDFTVKQKDDVFAEFGASLTKTYFSIDTGKVCLNKLVALVSNEGEREGDDEVTIKFGKKSIKKSTRLYGVTDWTIEKIMIPLKKTEFMNTPVKDVFFIFN